MANILGIITTVLEFSEDQYPKLSDIEKKLADDSAISHVAIIHCETTTGIINPIQEIGQLVHKHGRHYIVDAMSSFGAIPIDMHSSHIHYLISSANKCLHGVPGFSFIIADIMSLLETEGYARSLSLNLLEQYRDLEKNGQFRFTPPTHALVAFRQALIEFEQQGDIRGRAKRYKANFEVLGQGMRRLGFKEFLPAQKQSYIISTFLYPKHPNFNFETFYSRLNEKGFVIYPGKLGRVECFRIGTIGEIHVMDIKNLLVEIENTLKEMKII
jgi:2-aminoethylphosphonate-pyruvate transaminase